MSFFFIGLVVLAAGIHYRTKCKQDNDEAGVSGMNAVVVAGVILVLLYGTIYRLTILG